MNNFSRRFLAAALWLMSSMAHGELFGFQPHYSAKVNGVVWMLDIEPNKMFGHMLIGNLEFGDMHNRYVLMGAPDEAGVLRGTFRAFFGAEAKEYDFSLQRQDERNALLKLDGPFGLPPEGLTLVADEQLAPIDNSLIGVWFSDPAPGVRIDQPAISAQWVIDFHRDGTLCQHHFHLDTSKDEQYRPPCDVANVQRWRATKGEVHINTDGRWKLAFTYRIMGGHLMTTFMENGRREMVALARDEALSTSSR